ncbi:hypothetical protein GCM10011571_27460 [Marinithermofilum abyssi]|uniref:Uncharacterized protein n=1 Tax=Marinithermofilum abyssi TaxID=1571185 RepID=A0A8J2YE36_9BACL|nr:hypothetical protein GCM10011571_27460 [Marinithermofilum abyssi]
MLTKANTFNIVPEQIQGGSDVGALVPGFSRWTGEMGDGWGCTWCVRLSSYQYIFATGLT